MNNKDLYLSTLVELDNKLAKLNKRLLLRCVVDTREVYCSEILKTSCVFRTLNELVAGVAALNKIPENLITDYKVKELPQVLYSLYDTQWGTLDYGLQNIVLKCLNLEPLVVSYACLDRNDINRFKEFVELTRFVGRTAQSAI